MLGCFKVGNMKAQKSHQQSSRVLAANGSIANIERTGHFPSAKPVCERSPKRRESFKVTKSKRLEPGELYSPHADASDKTTGFMSSPVGNIPDSSAVRRVGYANRAYAPGDSPFAQYALMNYCNSNSHLNTSIYANPNISSLTGVDHVEQDVNNIFDDFEHFSFQTFPSYFNPREASNMPHQEKVNKWIESVPTFNVSGELWESECYSVNTDLDWEEKEFDRGLVCHESLPFSLATADEILHLQAKRLDTLVRRNYELTPEVPLTPRAF